MDGWICYRGVAGQVHVIPNADAFPHDGHAGCWCKPTNVLETMDLSEYIHHSADGRELFDASAIFPPATRH